MPMRHRRLLFGAVLAIALLAPFAARADELLVFAAASLKPSLDRILATPEAVALGGAKAS